MTPAEQLKLKLTLERRLQRQLGAYNAELVREFIRELGTSGAVLDPAQFDEVLADILDEHYRTTAERFAPVVVEPATDDGLRPEEQAALAAALAALFAGRAKRTAEEINLTTAERMKEQAAKARVEADSLQEAASVAGVSLHRDLKARAATTATTETQAAAEGAKAAAATVVADDTRAAPVKTWWTVGDSRVREAHVRADGQEVPVPAPFIVGGEQLNYPGDTSLGASAGNTINCRCIAEYDTAAIAEQRRAGA